MTLRAPIAVRLLSRIFHGFVYFRLVSVSRLVRLMIRLEGVGAQRLTALAYQSLLMIHPTRNDLRSRWHILLIEMGRADEAWCHFELNERECGFSPNEHARMLFRMQLFGRLDLVSLALVTFCERLGPKAWRFMPSILSSDMPTPEALHALSEAGDEGGMNIALGRLAFDYRMFDECARLLARGLNAGKGTSVDRLAMVYAASRAESTFGRKYDIVELVQEAMNFRADDQYPLLACEIALDRGQGETARRFLSEWLDNQVGLSDDLASISAAANAMLDAILACRLNEPLSETLTTRYLSQQGERPVVHKVFVCGNGWSGSGAMHNALQEYDTVVEFPQAARTALANKGSFSEVSVFQGASSLGSLWRELEKGRMPGWRDLWDFYRCHVLGGVWVGYPEYKCGVMTRTMQSAFGLAHWQQFEPAVAAMTSACQRKDDSSFRETLTALGESLCRQAVSHAGVSMEHAALVLNNAVFARNVDLLALFRQARAVLVHRDPRDVWADRKFDDDRHWRTVEEFARFYAINERRTRERVGAVEALGSQHHSIHRVAFEDLIGDGGERRALCEWALGPIGGRKVRQVLDPSRSRRNIGIYAERLDAHEQSVLSPLLRE